MGSDGAPFLFIYKRNGDTFTKLANPAILPPGQGRGVAFSPDGTYLAVAHTNSPFITIYKRSGDTFTKLANPANLPPNATNATFSPDGTYLVLTLSVSSSNDTNPRIFIYKRSGDTFTKLDDPAEVAPGSVFNADFSNDGTYLALAHFVSPRILIYKRSGDTFTKLPDPETVLPGNGRGVSFSGNGTYLAVAHDNLPRLTIYKNEIDTNISKANNLIDVPNATNLGYALEDGTEGQTKTMMSLFKEEE
jgi:Tol biopolymer transport system component